MKRTALQRTPMSRQRTPIRQRSAKTIAAAPEHDIVRERVFARDRFCQVHHRGYGAYAVGRCSGPLTPHHRRKASDTGGYTLENLVAVCAGHNVALEHDAGLARWARSVGLVVRRGDPEWPGLGRQPLYAVDQATASSVVSGSTSSGGSLPRDSIEASTS